MKRYLLSCAVNDLHEFRLPELDAIAHLYGFDISYPVAPDVTRPFMLIDLKSEVEAQLIGSRAISIKNIWEYWADADTYEELHTLVQREDCREKWSPIALDRATSWKFSVSAHGRTIPVPVQRGVIESFAYMDFLGDIDLKKPDVVVGVFEEYVVRADKQEKGRDLSEMRRVWMGRKLCDTQRHMMDTFDLKKRAYIGTTSMDAEVSLLMANQALAQEGKLCYDPFAGTGSMLLTAAAFGAMSFGSDIDGRQMRGKKTSIQDSAAQYGIRQRIVDCCSFDMTQHPFRTGELFDAIVTDPPYGVRAGAKRLGRKPDVELKQPTLLEGKGFAHQLPDYVPPSTPWEMTEVIATLVTFALYVLKPQGRLVFFLPTNSEEYRDVDIPQVPGLRLVANSSQSFGKWARRLITMEKVDDQLASTVIEGLDRGIVRHGMDDLEARLQAMRVSNRDQSEALDSLAEPQGERRRPGHAGFREFFFDEAGAHRRKQELKEKELAVHGSLVEPTEAL